MRDTMFWNETLLNVDVTNVRLSYNEQKNRCFDQLIYLTTGFLEKHTLLSEHFYRKNPTVETDVSIRNLTDKFLLGHVRDLPGV